MNTEIMKEAYGIFYEIEITLSQHIAFIMEETYGVGWLIKAPFTMKYKPYAKQLTPSIITNLSPCYNHTPVLMIYPKMFIPSF